MKKIPIFQDDYSQGFKATLKSFSDIGIKEFRGDAKKKACWWVNPEIFNAKKFESLIGEKFPEDTAKFLEKLKSVRQVTFTDLISAIDSTIKFSIKNTSQETYSFEGDVWSVGCFENSLFLELIDNFKERRKKIQVYGYIGNKEIDIDAFKDSRVRVTGKLSVHDGVLQITANNIDRIGVCSRIKQIEKWKAENRNLFKVTESKKVEYFDIVNIGLIATEGSHSHKDFMMKLYPVLQAKVKGHEKFIKISNINDIIDAIKEYNAEENKCSCICIVRGGGDSNDLIDYSKPELLQAIHDSKIKIITGIAHADDELLCDYVADYSTLTPTDAADYLNHVYNKRPKPDTHTKESSKSSSTSLEELQSENFELKYQIEYFISQLNDKDNRISQLEQQLNAKNNKGFFSRLFG